MWCVGACRGQKRASDFLKLEDRWLWDSWCGCLKLNVHPLEEQQVLLLLPVSQPFPFSYLILRVSSLFCNISHVPPATPQLHRLCSPFSVCIHTQCSLMTWVRSLGPPKIDYNSLWLSFGTWGEILLWKALHFGHRIWRNPADTVLEKFLPSGHLPRCWKVGTMQPAGGEG